MSNLHYRLSVNAENDRDAGRGARDLADTLREIKGVAEVTRTKEQESTMDLGAIVNVLASSGATVALATGIAQWIHLHRKATVTVERSSGTESIKVAVANVDPDAAARITEMIVTKK